MRSTLEREVRAPFINEFLERLTRWILEQNKNTEGHPGSAALMQAAAGVALSDLETWITETGMNLRRSAIRQMSAQGWSVREIAQQAGLSPSRVQQILHE